MSGISAWYCCPMLIRGSKLTGVASVIKGRTGGVISELVERKRLLDAVLGVAGGGRIWLLTAMLVRKVEK